jgi:hypothetical protein
MATAKFERIEYDSMYGNHKWVNHVQDVTIVPMKGCYHMITKHHRYVLNNTPHIGVIGCVDTNTDMCIEFDMNNATLFWYRN